jgi:DNA-binding CsgD family transcriptional regulator
MLRAMSPLRPEAIAELACSHGRLGAFEASVLEGLARDIGFDVAFFCGGGGVGEASLGLDPAVRPVAAQRWGEMSAECLEMLPAARREGGVIVDSEWFGSRLGRLVYYDTFMRPHRGRTTLIAFLEVRGVLLGELVLGSCRGSAPFSAGEAAALRRLVPVLSLSRHAYLGEGSSKSRPCTPRLAAVREAAAEGAALTAREREVLGYLHLGYTNQQIALALGSAPRTVRNQLSSVYIKLGVASRAEAVAWSLGQGSLERTAR